MTQGTILGMATDGANEGNNSAENLADFAQTKKTEDEAALFDNEDTCGKDELKVDECITVANDKYGEDWDDAIEQELATDGWETVTKREVLFAGTEIPTPGATKTASPKSLFGKSFQAASGLYSTAADGFANVYDTLNLKEARRRALVNRAIHKNAHRTIAHFDAGDETRAGKERETNKIKAVLPPTKKNGSG